MPAITVTAAAIAGYSKDCLYIIIYAVQVVQSAYCFCILCPNYGFMHSCWLLLLCVYTGYLMMAMYNEETYSIAINLFTMLEIMLFLTPLSFSREIISSPSSDSSSCPSGVVAPHVLPYPSSIPCFPHVEPGCHQASSYLCCST